MNEKTHSTELVVWVLHFLNDIPDDVRVDVTGLRP